MRGFAGILRTALFFFVLSQATYARPDEAVSGLVEGSLVVDGITRTYHVHLPPTYDGKTPVALLVVYHGGLRDGVAAAASFGLDATADQDGFIVVYPDGQPKTGTRSANSFFWNSSDSSFTSSGDDVKFTSELLDTLQSQYSIDPTRVFATGISNGAQMDYRVACDLSDRFAAIAPVSGSLETDPCTPTSPVALIDFHGTADPLVKYNGGGLLGFESHDYTISHWLTFDGCATTVDAPAQVTSLPVIVDDGTSVEVDDYGACQNGTGIEAVVINGGGHNWPSIAANFPYLYGQKYSSFFVFEVQKKITGKITHQISANDMMWDFFVHHPKQTSGQ